MTRTETLVVSFAIAAVLLILLLAARMASTPAELAAFSAVGLAGFAVAVAVAIWWWARKQR